MSDKKSSFVANQKTAKHLWSIEEMKFNLRSEKRVLFLRCNLYNSKMYGGGKISLASWTELWHWFWKCNVLA